MTRQLEQPPASILQSQEPRRVGQGSVPLQDQQLAEDNAINFQDKVIAAENSLHTAMERARKTIAEAHGLKDEYRVTREFENLLPGLVQFQEILALGIWHKFIAMSFIPTSSAQPTHQWQIWH